MHDKIPDRKTALSVSSLTHVVQDGLTATIFVLLPVLAQSFGLSYAQVGLLKGVNNASQAVWEFGSGWLSEWLGEIRLIIVGLGLSGLGYLLLSAAPSVWAIALCLLLVGAGTALHHAPSSSLIANSAGADRRGSALGLYNASGDVGKLVFTGCFSLAAGLGLSWYQISFAFGLVTLAASVAIALLARSASRSSGQQAAPDDRSTHPEARGWGILNWRYFSALLMITSLDTMVQTSLFVFVAFLMLAKGLPLYAATGATVLLLAGGVFGKAGCGVMADRLGTRRAFALIQVLTALGVGAIVAAPYWLALLLLLPLGAVAQGSSSITYGFAASLIHPKRMARGYALLYSVGTFASAIGPFLFGWVADGVGIEEALYLMALATLISIPPILILPSRQASVATGT